MKKQNTASRAGDIVTKLKAFLVSAQCPLDFRGMLEGYVVATWGDDDQREDPAPWGAASEICAAWPRPLTLQQALVVESFRAWDNWDARAEEISIDGHWAGPAGDH